MGEAACKQIMTNPHEANRYHGSNHELGLEIVSNLYCLKLVPLL